MRDIKFRARSIKDGKAWNEGHYYIEYGSMPHPLRTKKSPPPVNGDTHWIVFPSFADWGMPREMLRVQVDPDTLGQYIGLKDKNGVEIYHADLVKYQNVLWQIEWMWLGFVLMEPRNALNTIIFATKPEKTWPEELEVIGNIYENPEIEGGKV